jgi:hypothetical protein
MKHPVLLGILCVSLLSGCSATARLYPVSGPLSQHNPTPVYVGKITGMVDSGNFSVVLENGEVCKGQWLTVSRPNASSNASATPAQENLAAEWDSVYGAGFYVAHVLGARLYGRGTATGNSGTVLNFEIYRPEDAQNVPRGSIKGVAKDNKGNVYKLSF